MQFDIRALLSLEDEIDEAASFAFMQSVAEEAVEVPLLPEDIRSNREDISDLSCRLSGSYSKRAYARKAQCVMFFSKAV